jgi:hypothetical protein
LWESFEKRLKKKSRSPTRVFHFPSSVGNITYSLCSQYSGFVIVLISQTSLNIYNISNELQLHYWMYFSLHYLPLWYRKYSCSFQQTWST